MQSAMFYACSSPQSKIGSLKSKMSFYDPICPRQHFRCNGQSNLFRCLQIDHEFKLRCLLHRQISRFGTFQDLVHVNSRAPKEVIVVGSVGHETAGFANSSCG